MRAAKRPQIRRRKSAGRQGETVAGVHCSSESDLPLYENPRRCRHRPPATVHQASLPAPAEALCRGTRRRHGQGSMGRQWQTRLAPAGTCVAGAGRRRYCPGLHASTFVNAIDAARHDEGWEVRAKVVSARPLQPAEMARVEKSLAALARTSVKLSALNPDGLIVRPQGFTTVQRVVEETVARRRASQ